MKARAEIHSQPGSTPHKNHVKSAAIFPAPQSPYSSHSVNAARLQFLEVQPLRFLSSTHQGDAKRKQNQKARL